MSKTPEQRSDAEAAGRCKYVEALHLFASRDVVY